jgi:hypothetical protein
MSIDYARMQKLYPQQKAALTRAAKTKDPEKVIAACRTAVRQWNEIGAWPDNWSHWQRTLDDIVGWRSSPQLEDL